MGRLLIVSIGAMTSYDDGPIDRADANNNAIPGGASQGWPAEDRIYFGQEPDEEEWKGPQNSKRSHPAA